MTIMIKYSSSMPDIDTSAPVVGLYCSRRHLSALASLYRNHLRNGYRMPFQACFLMHRNSPAARDRLHSLGTWNNSNSCFLCERRRALRQNSRSACSLRFPGSALSRKPLTNQIKASCSSLLTPPCWSLSPLLAVLFRPSPRLDEQSSNASLEPPFCLIG